LKKTLKQCSLQLEKPRQRTEWSSEASLGRSWLEPSCSTNDDGDKDDNGWVEGPIWTLWVRQKFLVPVENRTAIPQNSCPYPSHSEVQ